MADVTLTDGAYRALLINDERFNYEALDLDASVITQDGNRAGVPEPQRATRAVLQASGEQENEVLTVTAKRGGFVRDRAGAAFTWESTGVTGEIGWETPTAINDVIPVVVNTPSFARKITTSPAICSLPDGRVVAAFNRQNTSSLDKASTRTRFPNGSWQSIVDVGINSPTNTLNRNRYALVWDDSRQQARLYVLWRDTSVVDLERGRLSMYTSDDGGLTWDLNQEDCLTTALDWSSTTGYSVTSISVALSGNSLGCLLISATSSNVSLDLFSTVVQYASSDGGFTFDLVEAYEPTSANDTLGGVGYTVYADPGGAIGFRVIWASAKSPVIGTPYTADLGSPYINWSNINSSILFQLSTSISSITAKVVSPVSITVAVDSNGSAWAYYSAFDLSEQRVVAIFINSVGEASRIGDIIGNEAPWAIGSLDAAEGLEEIAATFVSGQVILIGRMMESSATSYTGALIAFTLGGYNSATRRPVSFGGYLPDSNAPYEVDWFGIASFGSFTPWSVASVGPPALSLDTDLGYTVDCSGNITHSYQATSTPSATLGYQGQAQIICKVLSGKADFTVKRSDIINLRLRITPTGITIRDMDNAVDVGTVVLPTPGEHIIRVSWHINTVGTLLWRVEVTPWTKGATVRSWDSYNGTITPISSIGNRVRVDVTYPDSAVFYHVGYTTGGNGSGLAEDTITPRPFSSKPSLLYHGVSLALTSGPVMSGDSWVINPWYDYGVRRIFQELEPSPRAKFKATALSTASITSLVFDLTDGGQAVRLGSPVLGFGIFGANFRTAEVYTSTTSSGPWTKIADVDMSCGLNGLSWERVGYTVSAPGSSPNTGPHYIAENSLAGGSFIYKSGEHVRILRNTGGVWQNGSNVKRPRLTLDGQSVDATGNTGVIVYPDALVMLYGVQNLQYLRFSIPTQTTPSGVVELGSLVFGRVEILGKQYGRGRSLEIVPSVDTFTAANGSRRTRTLAPNRRLITVDWQENAIDTTQAYQESSEIDFVRAATGQTPAAYVAATSDQVKGLLTQIEGAPLVYISKLTPDTPVMISPASILRGRVLGPLTFDSILGDEEDSEVIRIAGFTIEEEL